MQKFKRHWFKTPGASGVVAVDTNVVVRLLTRDDEAQYRLSEKLFDNHDIFIPDTLFLEAEWVLRAAFELSPREVCTAFRRICGLANVTVSDATLLAQVFEWHELGFDFADAFHLALSKHQSMFKTFDARFIKIAKKHSSRAVERP